MVSVSSLCVGKELLIGKTVNTNAYWIGARLLAAGIMLDRIITVTDDLGEISWGLLELLDRKPDFVLVVGGLGPTPDDMTLRGVAMALGREMSLNEVALQMIRDHYANTGRGNFVMTPARRKMAVLPEGAVPLVNRVGTAPGVMILEGETVIVCLPGVPKEMKSIYTQSVDDEIRKKVGPLHQSRVTMQLEGVFESTLTPAIARGLKEHPRAYIKSHPKGIRGGVSRVELDIIVTHPSQRLCDKECKELASYFREKVAEEGGKIVKTRSSWEKGHRRTKA